MKHATPLVLAAGLAAAQSTTVVNLLIPAADPQAIVASVISADPTATTYYLKCPDGTDATDCGLADGVSVINGPSTLAYTYLFSENSIIAHCSLYSAKDEANCDGTLIEAGTTSLVTEVLTGYLASYMPVTVTAGIEKLAAATSAEPTTGAAPTTVDRPEATTLVTSSDAAPTSVTKSEDDAASTGVTKSEDGAAESSAAAASSSTSTGGMPRITQNAAILGAAALVGGAMLI
ncbi:hypothetical protein N0V88_005091 [Collariella sp. IMI 366227]|nr:hypothetical protein N0V88_005091 [Collariella sp. IMI 366227]